MTKKELECSATLKDIVDAGFRLDVPLSNGLFPLEMVCKHKHTDILLLIMLKSVTDSHVFFPRGESLLFCILDKHPLTIRTFIGRNVPLKTKNGRSAFDIYTGIHFKHIQMHLKIKDLMPCQIESLMYTQVKPYFANNIAENTLYLHYMDIQYVYTQCEIASVISLIFCLTEMTFYDAYCGYYDRLMPGMFGLHI